MQPEYKRAVELAFREKRLWLGGLLCALCFSEAWWIIYGWGPRYLGERTGDWARGTGGDGPGTVALFIAIAVFAFIVTKAIGYLGETVLIRQVADAQSTEVPTFTGALDSSRSRYLPVALTLLPWDALRVAVIYLPALFILVWNRWDPHYDRIGLYFLVLLVWFAMLVAVYVLAGICVTLAARLSLLGERDIPECWSEGWELFREYPSRSFAIWLQALSADLIFLLFAWPLSVLVPWMVGQFADELGVAPLRWLIYTIVYLALAALFVGAQTCVQCYKSSLWTVFFLGLKEEREEGGPPIIPSPEWFPEPPAEFMPPSSTS
jgi:hypothetical protein